MKSYTAGHKGGLTLLRVHIICWKIKVSWKATKEKERKKHQTFEQLEAFLETIKKREKN